MTSQTILTVAMISLLAKECRQMDVGIMTLTRNLQLRRVSDNNMSLDIQHMLAYDKAVTMYVVVDVNR